MMDKADSTQRHDIGVCTNLLGFTRGVIRGAYEGKKYINTKQSRVPVLVFFNRRNARLKYGFKTKCCDLYRLI